MCAIARSGQGERGTLTLQEFKWPGPLASALQSSRKGTIMNRIIYIIGAVVVIVAVLSFFGLR
jgi:hypothetical protein